MAYLSDCDWDIFVSYAHDDKPKVGPAAKWIVRFKEALAVELNRYTGEHFNIYFDEDAQRFDDEIENILAKVRKSGIFLMIGSPNFVASPWCRNEIRTFREEIGDPSRIFIAEIMALRGRDYPVDVPNNLQARFWTREDGPPITLTSGDPRYKLLFAKMANQIFERIEKLREAKPRPVPPAPGPQPVKHVPAMGAVPGKLFVAYGREVDEERDALVSYLAGLDVAVVDLPTEMPEDEAELASSIERGIGEASVYVQLLSRRPIRPLGEGSRSPTALQLEAAHKALGENDIFLWRPDDLDPEKNPDPDYKEMLRRAENPTIAELAKAIRDRMIARAAEIPAGRDDPIVLVINADPEDREFADELMDACNDRECMAILDDYANDDKDGVDWSDASAVAFVQGNVPRAWLTARCIVFNRVLAGRRGASQSKGQVILYAPPGPKAQVRISGMTRFDQIDVSNQWSTAPFEQWLDKIGARRVGD
ncbi:MAG TPA: toll/interleukin-1 receptor domain-containing protein [Allosphingosinicella sp.]|nr:toll/interleukin-1 receptor domain-containing protein [Allosphingosinicella sp.]